MPRLAPVPFVSSTVLCGQVLAGCGEAAAPYLERIAAGEIASPALTDDRGRWAADDVACTSDGATVSGSVRFAPFGASAGFFVVAARTDAGIDVFVVEAADADVTALPSLDFSRPVGDRGAQRGTGGPAHHRRAGSARRSTPASTSPCSPSARTSSGAPSTAST